MIDKRKDDIMDNQYNYNESENQNIYTPNLELERKIEENKQMKQMKKEKRNRRMKKFVSILCAGLLFGVVSAGAFIGVTYLGNTVLDSDASTASTGVEATVVTSTADNGSESDVAEIVSEVMPSIVSITNLSIQEIEYFLGQSSTYESESVGSGIIVSQTDTELLILTNNHVIADGDTITVTFCNEDNIEGVVKGADEDMDLAIVAIDLENVSEETLSSIKIATLGASESLQVGETVIAIGNALGYGQSVTTGVVSALNRTIDGFDTTLIQTDAAINAGNSGGALLNSSGEVIGINSAKVGSESVEGMGYAIPISEAMETITELMNMETRELVDEADRGYLGISGVSVTEESAAMYSMPVGIFVAEVAEGGAAYEAGLTKGIIITELDGSDVSTIEELQEKLAYYAIDDEVIITIETLDENGDYIESEVTVTLLEYPETE